MSYNEFNCNRFHSEDSGRILSQIRAHKEANGIPTKIEVLRRIAKTKRKTITPDGWKWI